MRGSRYFLLGLALAIAGGALAIDTGGFPSHPILSQIIGNSGATSATSLISPRLDATLYSILGRSQAGPCVQGRWDSGTSNRYLSFGTCDNSGVYTELARVDGATNTFQTNGQPVRKVTEGQLTIGTSACTLNPAISSLNIVSCSRTGAGSYTLALTSGYSGAPCFTQVSTGSAVVISTATATSTLNITASNTAGTPTDFSGIMNVFCQGT
jgi:hypothetical protein